MTERFANLNSEKLTVKEGFDCECGMHHSMYVKYLNIGSGVINNVAKAVETIGSSYPVVVCAPDTYEQAGKKVTELLTKAGIKHKLLVVPLEKGFEKLEPAEYTTGSIVLNLDKSCDLIIAVGSGVVNDTCRVVSTMAKIPELVVGTAPSMDGYASASSSMVVNNIKQSLSLRAPDGLILDTDIMKDAPMKLLAAGLGDMLAKYTALCEWKIVKLLFGEHYCPEVAALVKSSVDKVVANAEGLRNREPQAVEAVAEGLVSSGIGMAFVGNSRPASGLDHYFSHAWEMMALARGKAYELHGIQVGLGTMYAVMMLNKLKTIKPSIEHVKEANEKFSKDAWEANIRRVFGPTADGIIAMEDRLKKNDPQGRLERARKIIDNWDEIIKIIDENIPSVEGFKKVMETVGLPMNPEGIMVTKEDAIDAFVCSRDIRDKYLTSSLIWDIGYMDEFADYLKKEIGM